MRVENSSSTNMGGMHIIQNIPPSSGEGAFVDESLLAVKLTILWVVFCAVVDFATCATNRWGWESFLQSLRRLSLAELSSAFDFVGFMVRVY